MYLQFGRPKPVIKSNTRTVCDWINFSKLYFILDDKLIIFNKELTRKLKQISVPKSIRSLSTNVSYVYISMYVSFFLSSD